MEAGKAVDPLQVIKVQGHVKGEERTSFDADTCRSAQCCKGA
jgi:hypothetical protein